MIALAENERLDAARRKLFAFRTDTDDFQTYAREVYWLCRTRSSDSDFSLARMEKELGVRGTFRNANTVRKMAARYASPRT